MKKFISRKFKATVLREDRNCWRKACAERVGYAIDAAIFFTAFHEAAQKARRQIFILGWDTDSRVELVRGDETHEPVRLKDFLVGLCEAHPNLEIFVLSWNFSFIYSLERETFPEAKFMQDGHPRLHYHLDAFHPALGSQHQKVVVIDDQIAFSGGLDITARRWDTPEHLAYDKRRIDPWGKFYGPFHDVQIAVAGPAAKALGDLARERWKKATGQKIAAPPFDPMISLRERWPESLPVELENIEVGISRTVPSMPGQKPVREVERLFTDSIARAKRFIFFEAQYLSSKSVARALARRLRERNGPEVVMILARDATGWIEESTMSVLRARVLEIIRKSDHARRFRIFNPVVPELTDGYVKVHSKVTVIDDTFARIGSANLNQRSMGLDSECDIAFEAIGAPPEVAEKITASIASLRSRLMAEHLGVSPKEVEETFGRTGSLLKTIEELQGGPRTLVELTREIPAWLDLVIPESRVIDPSNPYRARFFLRRYFPYFTSATAGQVHWLGRFKIVSLASILLLIFVLWKTTPAGEWIQPERISFLMETIRHDPLAPLYVLIGFVVGGLAMVPVTALIFATALTFAGWSAFFLAIGGALASAMVTYWIGKRFSADSLARISNRWLLKAKTHLSKGGWMAIAIVRMLPIAPFTVVNLVAGSLRLSFRDYVLGTIAGLVPGVLLFTVLAVQIGETLRSPDYKSLFLLSLVFLAAFALARLIQYLARGARA